MTSDNKIFFSFLKKVFEKSIKGFKNSLKGFWEVYKMFLISHKFVIQ